jgi:hypothetical protein
MESLLRAGVVSTARVGQYRLCSRRSAGHSDMNPYRPGADGDPGDGGEGGKWPTSRKRASGGARARRPVAVPASRWRLLTDRCLSGTRRTRAARFLGFLSHHGPPSWLLREKNFDLRLRTPNRMTCGNTGVHVVVALRCEEGPATIMDGAGVVAENLIRAGEAACPQQHSRSSWQQRTVHVSRTHPAG